MADTRIPVSEDTWRHLNAAKDPGDSFDDVLSRLLRHADERDGVEAAAAVAVAQRDDRADK